MKIGEVGFTLSGADETSVREREKFSGERLAGASAIAVLAVLYSLWAIVGSGADTVFWGFLLLLAGVPFYWMQVRKAGKEVETR